METLESAQVPVEACISSSTAPVTKVAPRQSALVSVTHWIITLSFFALLVTGIEIVISHLRFYGGETGNVLTTPLFQLHIPFSKALAPTGSGYVLPDQNGWSRALHFETAWIAVLTGLLYAIPGLFTGHFRKDLLPSNEDLSWRALSTSIAKPLRHERPSEAEASSYHVHQPHLSPCDLGSVPFGHLDKLGPIPRVCLRLFRHPLQSDKTYLQQRRRSCGLRPIRVLTSGNHGVGRLETKSPDTPEHLKYEQETTLVQAHWLGLSSNARQIFACNSSEYSSSTKRRL